MTFCAFGAIVRKGEIQGIRTLCRMLSALSFPPLPVFAKKHGHFEQELSIRLVSTIDGNS
jgi:uncharacterized membrane protein YqaE (UPF0057 family)